LTSVVPVRVLKNKPIKSPSDISPSNLDGYRVADTLSKKRCQQPEQHMPDQEKCGLVSCIKNFKNSLILKKKHSTI
jgi:hypothetical protein